MLFLARVLHLPNGEKLRNVVVCAEDSRVKEFYSFVEEKHSMLLVDELFLSSIANLKNIEEIKNTPHSERCEGMYVYRLSVAGELVLLEC